MAWYGKGIFKGLQITLRNMRRGPVTLQYPLERNVIPDRARWAVAMKLDEDGNHKCTSCHACVRACPDAVLSLEDTTGEDRSKHIDRFTYELGACMMCGLCVAACPFDAIEMSHNYELSVVNPDGMTYNFLEDVPAASAKKAPRPAPDGAAAGDRPARVPRARAAAAEGAEGEASAAPERPARVPRARAAAAEATATAEGSDAPAEAPAAPARPPRQPRVKAAAPTTEPAAEPATTEPASVEPPAETAEPEAEEATDA